LDSKLDVLTKELMSVKVCTILLDCKALPGL
jgi:hypothetical protein